MKLFRYLCLFCCLGNSLLMAQAPEMTNYQGVLSDPLSGEAVEDTLYQLTFSIYDVAVGGSALWSEIQMVQTRRGVFSSLLGAVNPLTPAILGGPERYLGVRIGNDPELQPRRRLVSSLYAIMSVDAAKLAGIAADSFALKNELAASDGNGPNQGSNQVSWDNLVDVPAGFADGIDDIGGGLGGGNTLDEAYDEGASAGAGRIINADAGAVAIQGPDGLEVSGKVQIGNGTLNPSPPGPAELLVSAPNGVVFTGADNQGVIPREGAGKRLMWYGRKAAFRAGEDLGIAWNDANIGSHSLAIGSNNIASGEYSIAGGITSSASAFAAVAIGNFASAEDSFAIAIGDEANAIGTASLAIGKRVDANNEAAVAFGLDVLSDGRASFAAGRSTEATGNFSVALGTNSRSLGYSSAAIGFFTTASGSSAVAVGNSTTASGDYSFASGLGSNAVGLGSTSLGSNTQTFGTYATSFGNLNSASGLASLAAGQNSATSVAAHVSTVIGGNCTSDAAYSFAGGQGATVLRGHNGTFLWADNFGEVVSVNFVSTIANEFAARASGGVRFVTQVLGDGTPSIGVRVPGGGNSWVAISDSTLKENFRLLDGETLLNKFRRFKLGTWNYKGQDPGSFRHYGPMAQDFFAAFGNDGTGIIGNDTTIACSDFHGVNFTAIQALEARTAQLRKEMTELRELIALLQRENTTMRRAMASHNEQ